MIPIFSWFQFLGWLMIPFSTLDSLWKLEAPLRVRHRRRRPPLPMLHPWAEFHAAAPHHLPPLGPRKGHPRQPHGSKTLECLAFYTKILHPQKKCRHRYWPIRNCKLEAQRVHVFMSLWDCFSLLLRACGIIFLSLSWLVVCHHPHFHWWVVPFKHAPYSSWNCWNPD